MLRGAPLVILVAALGNAPFQCGSETDPSSMLEETPGEALYLLAERFRERGDLDAWRETLEHLIERYPNSRYAVAAKQDLASAGPRDAVAQPVAPPARAAAPSE